MMMRRVCAVTFVWVCTLACGSLSFQSCGSLAVAEELTAVERRSQMYAELAEEVAALERQGNLLKRVVRLVKPTVVHIEAKRPTEANSRTGRRSIEEAGSGVVIEYHGKRYVVTNRHVIRDTPRASIDVHFDDGRMLHPLSVWSDRFTDVAVMEVRGSDLIPARIGDSDRVDIGDFALAVGSPFGLSHSVTYGIISAKGRRDLDLGDGSIRYKDFLQTDAAINPGNSGGPLFNLRGEVIGINTAIASSSGGSEGIGFTIPINMAITVAKQLIDEGRSARSYLGVNLNPAFGPLDASRLGLARPRGAHVRSVTPNSPAARAKVQPNDVVVEFDNHRIEDDDHLIKVVGFTPVGKQVKVVVFRGGKLLTLAVEVVDRSTFE